VQGNRVDEIYLIALGSQQRRVDPRAPSDVQDPSGGRWAVGGRRSARMALCRSNSNGLLASLTCSTPMAKNATTAGSISGASSPVDSSDISESDASRGGAAKVVEGRPWPGRPQFHDSLWAGLLCRSNSRWMLSKPPSHRSAHAAG
jgi:hypothetical protein